jgi:hypothetical protein
MSSYYLGLFGALPLVEAAMVKVCCRLHPGSKRDANESDQIEIIVSRRLSKEVKHGKLCPQIETLCTQNVLECSAQP